MVGEFGGLHLTREIDRDEYDSNPLQPSCGRWRIFIQVSPSLLTIFQLLYGPTVG